MPRPKAVEPKNASLSFRLTANERQEVLADSAALGFKSVSDYFRHLRAAAVAERIDRPQELSSTLPLASAAVLGDLEKFHSTRLGTIYLGDSRKFLFNVARPHSVDLIMTSPPFGLVRKKSYGNEDSERYCEWFRPFAEGFRRVLKENGSLVIDIGGAWMPGQPTRSLYHFELLVMLCKEFGFHLCQEHFWWNPSKLPTPAEWVNIRRVRVKDAVNCIWWLSPTPWPKANNRRVLAPYSDAMKDLLENGYTAKLRPSGHDISKKFQRDNGGSVPPNLLAIANTESNGRYQDYCRENKINIHPARFPSLLPAYFIRFLTNPGDIVLDPFAGSCVTGAVAEGLRRKWICVELSREYLSGAMARFEESLKEATSSRTTRYVISTPGAMPVDETAVSVIRDGGKARPATRTALQTALRPRAQTSFLEAESSPVG